VEVVVEVQQTVLLEEMVELLFMEVMVQMELLMQTTHLMVHFPQVVLVELKVVTLVLVVVVEYNLFTGKI
jgi:hypothetical protein